MTTKSVDPSHIILALNFHLLKSEIWLVTLEDGIDRSLRNVGEELKILAV
jgi:hypothetical protein